MLRSTLAAAAMLCLAGLPIEAAPPDHAPPPAPFRKVSELVKLPDFLPGMGTLYVDPKTLPEGPFLAYDQTGRLVSTIYMVPLAPLSRLATPVTPPPEVWNRIADSAGLREAFPASCCAMVITTTDRPGR